MSDGTLRVLLVGDADTERVLRAEALETDTGDVLARVPAGDPNPFEIEPDVVLLEDGAPHGVASAVRDWRARGGITPTVAVLADRDDSTTRAEARRSGADAVFDRLAPPEELGAAVRLLLRMRRAENCARSTGGRAAALERMLVARTDAFVEALESLVEAARPGASVRSSMAADLARQLAERFAVPERFSHDLERAARLIELGRLADGADHPGNGAVLRAQTAECVLQRIEGLEGVATLLGSMAEHWDGTGGPRHMMSGQIPLRSRILGLLEGLLSHLDAHRPHETESAYELLVALAGTRYDPMVVTHLGALLRGGGSHAGATGPVLVPIDDLREGMVLAEDLYTDSGFKLLPRGARISGAALGTLHRRHQVEPLHAAVVDRATL